MEASINTEQSDPEVFNLFTEWWFYLILFFGLYAFAVAVHLSLDYQQWEKDRATLIAEEAESPQKAAEPSTASSAAAGSGRSASSSAPRPTAADALNEPEVDTKKLK